MPRIPTPEALELIALRFRALSEANRLRVLMCLEEGECSVSELGRRIGTTQPNVSKHLKVLQEAGLVTRRQVGNSAFYAVSDRTVYELCDLVCSGIRERLEAQARLLGA